MIRLQGGDDAPRVRPTTVRTDAQPSLQVGLVDRFARSWPKYSSGAPMRYVSLADALATAHTWDAHTVAYSVPTVDRRLGTPQVFERLDGVPMVLYIVDVDDPEVHGTSKPVRPEWWAAERPKVELLLVDHPGGYVYRTRGGYRIIYRLAEEVVLRSTADAETWKRRYIASLESLAERYGIVGDRACQDWTRHYRLPRVTRDGVLHEYETIGDARAIGLLDLNLIAPEPAPHHVTTSGPPPATIGIAADDKGTIDRGERHGTLVSIAWALRSRGAPLDEIQAALENANRRCAPPKPADEIRRIAEWAAEQPVGESTSPRRSLVTKVVELAHQQCELWHDNAEPYATVDAGTHREHHLVTGTVYRRWLAAVAFRELRLAVGETTLRDAVGTLAGIAIREGAVDVPYVRVAGMDDRIYVDLCDERWRAIEITPDGWSVVDRPAVRFVRRGAMRLLPEPVRGGALAELRDHIRVTDESWPLVAGWLVGALAPLGPYPLLVLRGPHGSGKSHAARVLRSLIDPSMAPIRSEPREARDLIVAARGSWIVALDNLSSVPPWLSDGLCRLATGGGYSARALYTDSDEIVIDVQRPTILTGITDVVTAPDLLDRALVVELEAMPPDARKTERELFASWTAARPRALGALLDAVSCSLRRRDAVELPSPPRLADWAVAATAAEPALGLADGDVIRALDEMGDDATEIALEASPIVEPLRLLVVEREWIGTMAELLGELEIAASLAVCVPDPGLEGRLAPQPRSPSSRRDWPMTARSLAAMLARLAPVLREIGIVVEKLPRGHGGVRRYRIAGTEVAAP